MSLPFLLEIGTEEIPDWMVETALASLKGLVQAHLDEHQLQGRVTRTEGTPRRLALWAEGIVHRQSDTEELVTGPPKAAAYKDGQPTGAAVGFAKKWGVAVEDLRLESTPKGEYLAVKRNLAGRAAIELLAEALPDLLPRITFPKTMYWTGKGGPRFIRPIRWIVALLGDDVVRFELAGVKAGRDSQSHRQLGHGALPVTVEDYEQKLRDGFVLVAATERRERIEGGIQALLQGTVLTVTPDPALLQTLTYLTEFPTPILGSFDDSFLTLPEEVLVTVMRHHQRYFSLKDAEGKLAPRFLAVTNTQGDPQGLIRHGHERVLRARFKDGQFFFDTDRQRSLESRLELLKNVTFQAKLGSYFEKTERIRALADKLASRVGVNPRMVDRAALLCKCDLTTEMVKEFTELQGIVGGLYAEREGEPSEVSHAIYDHYKPVSMEDEIPRTLVGQVVAIADKVDTLRGSFSIGMIPSGSKDPFALRRAAQGVVKILAEGDVDLSVKELSDGSAELQEFFLDRIRYYFRDLRGYRYDEVNAVLKAGYDHLGDVERRLDAVKAVRPTENFEPVAASFKRIQNILKQANFLANGAHVALYRCSDEPEQALLEAYLRLRDQLEQRAERSDYRGALEDVAALRPVVDRFFDKVLVNDPDTQIRTRRLTLLQALLQESSRIADFSEIVTG